jgi:uncharacterized protein (TIGR00369 family)
MDDFLEMGRRVLASQPFSVWIGAEMVDFAAGRVELALPIAPHLTQQYGQLHGGVIGYLADNALTFAGGSVLGIKVITSEYKINFLRPASGERLVARACVVHATRRQAVSRCDVFAVQDGQEVLCATAQGTIVKYGREG